MDFNKDLIAGKLRRWEKYIDNYRLPRWEDIPDMGLYMEQVIMLLKQYLDYLPPELKEEQFITAATINNYVRKKIMPEPVNRKYFATDSTEEIIYLSAIISGFARLFAEKLLMLEGKDLDNGGDITIRS